MSWNSEKLRDVAVFHYGKALPAKIRVDGSVPVYGSGGIVGTHDKPLVKGPGIIVGRKGTVGATYWQENDFFPIDTVFYVKPKGENTKIEFLYYLLRTLPLSSMNSDAAVPGLNRENAYSLNVDLPDLSTQECIASILSAYDKLVENNQRRIALLEQASRLLYREWFVHFRFPGHETASFNNGVPDGWQRTSVGEHCPFKRLCLKLDRDFRKN